MISLSSLLRVALVALFAVVEELPLGFVEVGESKNKIKH